MFVFPRYRSGFEIRIERLRKLRVYKNFECTFEYFVINGECGRIVMNT